MAKTGPPDWALGPQDDVEEGGEVRLNEDGTIDEIVTHEPMYFHLEQMGEFDNPFATLDRDGVGDVGIIDRVFALRAKIADLQSKIGQYVLKLLL